jgi:hypothetical protein
MTDLYEKWLGLAQMFHQELVSQHNITHWSHTKAMEWSSTNGWGVVAANCFSLVSDWSDTFNKLLTGLCEKNWLGLEQMVSWELVSQQNIIHWSHTKTMEWSSSKWWGVMAANCFSLVSERLVSSKLLTQSWPKTDLAWHRWSARSWFHSTTSLIGHIPRPWNGPAAMDEVLWLQTASVWSQTSLMFP